MIDPDLWQALVDDDRHRALGVVKRLRGAGATTSELVRDQLVPAQRLVGDLWATGEWSVAREHAATSVNEGLLLWLGSFTPEPPADAPRVVVANVDGERHAMAALVVAEMLVGEGVRVDLVPAPSDDDVEGVGARIEAALDRSSARDRPTAVLLSASLTSSLGRARELVRRVVGRGVPVVVGGQAFGDDESRALAIGATAWCADPREVPSLLGVVHASAPVAPAPEARGTSADEEDRVWLESYREQVVDYVVVGLRQREVAAAAGLDDLRGWVDHLVGCLSATLATGDETILLEADEWLVRVLGARGIGRGLVGEILGLLAVPVAGRPAAAAALGLAVDLLDAGREISDPEDTDGRVPAQDVTPDTAPLGSAHGLPGPA